jgi:hypothetical protein
MAVAFRTGFDCGAGMTRTRGELGVTPEEMERLPERKKKKNGHNIKNSLNLIYYF